MSIVPCDQLRCMLPPLEEFVRQWLHEDIPSFDYGGAVVGKVPQVATLFCKAEGVVAGCPFFDAVFDYLGCKVEWKVPEGTFISLADKDRVAVATVTGPANSLLQGERTALNLLARASGIASKTRRFVEIKKKQGWAGNVAGTRKTTPGLRLLEKHAMLVGGADQHRVDLSSMIMLKDNHIWSHGNITEAVKAARSLGGFALKVEVECGSIKAAEEAIDAGADIVMLDNMDPEEFKATALLLKERKPSVIIEGSGGITEETIASYMGAGVDVLSTSAIHQGVPHIDFSLKINKNK